MKKQTTVKRNGAARGFDFTRYMHLLCADISQRLDVFGFLRPNEIAYSFSQTRKAGYYGAHASLTPMRFENGSLVGVRSGRRYRAQRLYNKNGCEMLYILRFYMPRFQNLSFEEKLTTVLHELWHVSPDFNGDIRRHEGRCHVHTHSQKEYDRQMRILGLHYISLDPPESLLDPLRLDFHNLAARCGPVFGARIARPKLIPLRDAG